MPVGIANGRTLVARWYESDGAALFRDWRDTHNDVTCTFQVASDGRWRCLPTDYSIGYGDAACTKPIVSVYPCATVPRYVVGPERALACGDTGRPVYAVDQPTADQAYYYTDATGCHRGINSTTSVLYAVHEVALDGFVAAELVHEGAGTVQSYAFHAEDGAVEATSAWDVVRDAECRGFGADEAALCEPNEIALAYDTLWADATCSLPAAADLSRVRPCATPSAVLAYLGEDYVREYREIRERISEVYTSDAGTCSATTPLPGDVFYAEGPVIQNSTLPALHRVLDGGGRIRAVRYEETGGVPLAIATQLRDTTTDAPCFPYKFTDGTTRCVTSTHADATYEGGPYLDASCTHPLATAEKGVVVPFILVWHADPSCDESRYEAFAPGTEYTGPIYGGPSCQPLAPSPETTYLTLGDALDLPVLDER